MICIVTFICIILYIGGRAGCPQIGRLVVWPWAPVVCMSKWVRYWNPTCECVQYVCVNSTVLCIERFIALMSRLAPCMTGSSFTIWICVFVCGMCCKALSVVGRLEALYNCSPFGFSLKHLMSLVSRNLKHLYLLFQRNSYFTRSCCCCFITTVLVSTEPYSSSVCFFIISQVFRNNMHEVMKCRHDPLSVSILLSL